MKQIIGLALLITACTHPVSHQTEVVIIQKQHAALTPLANQFIANGTWKLVYNANTHLWAMNQKKMGWGYLVVFSLEGKTDNALDRPNDIGCTGFGLDTWPVIMSKDTMYLKECLEAYLVHAHQKDLEQQFK